jgi:hypothetical protein
MAAARGPLSQKAAGDALENSCRIRAALGAYLRPLLTPTMVLVWQSHSPTASLTHPAGQCYLPTACSPPIRSPGRPPATQRPPHPGSSTAAISPLHYDTKVEAVQAMPTPAALVCMLIPVLRVISELAIVLRGKVPAVTGRVVAEAGPTVDARYRPAKSVIGLAVGELLYARRRVDG